MAYFQELNTATNVILDRIFSSQDLCKLLYYNSPNPLSQANISDTSSLLMNNVYPLPKMPDAEKDKKGILNMYFYSAKPFSRNSGFKHTYLCFDIMCHLDIWMINTGVRPYSISNEIDVLFNDQYIKDLSLRNVYWNEWSVKNYSDYYSGYHLVYALSQDNNLGC